MCKAELCTFLFSHLRRQIHSVRINLDIAMFTGTEIRDCIGFQAVNDFLVRMAIGIVATVGNHAELGLDGIEPRLARRGARTVMSEFQDIGFQHIRRIFAYQDRFGLRGRIAHQHV